MEELIQSAKLLLRIGLWLNSRKGLDPRKGLQLEWIRTAMVWCHISVPKIYSHPFLFSCTFFLLSYGSCKVLPTFELNLLFLCINQSLCIWNFSISLWGHDDFPGRELLGNLMRKKNALDFPSDCSPSPSPPSSLQLPSFVDSTSPMWVLWHLAIPPSCSSPLQLSLDDCSCHLMGLLTTTYSLLLLLPYRARQRIFLQHHFMWSPAQMLFFIE